MRILYTTNRKAFAITVAIAAAGLLFASEASAEKISVSLKINEGQTALEVSSRGNCSNHNHKGCVQVTKYKPADIHFNLNSDKKCNMADDAQWELTQVYLGGKNSETKPLSWGNLDAEVATDFDVADAASGLLNVQNGSNPQNIRVSNKNTKAYSVWYTVVASCMDRDGNVMGTLEVDPRVKNTGGNN